MRSGLLWLSRGRIDDFIVGPKHGLKELVHSVVMRDVICTEIDVGNRPDLIVLGEPTPAAQADVVVEHEARG